MLEVQEVARIHLVNRDVPERREVEIAQVLFLPLRRPAAIDVGQVVVRAAWLRFERSWRPHRRKRPPVEFGCRCDDDRLDAGSVTIACSRRNASSSLTCSCAAVTSFARRRMLFLGGAPGGLIGSPPFNRPATERNSSCTSCSSRSAMASRRSARERDAFVELQLLFELLPSEPERGLRARREIGLQVVDVRLDGGRGLGGRVREVAEDVQVVERRERARAGRVR